MQNTSFSTQKMIYKNFDEAADNILKMMSGQLDINTLFIAKNDRCNNKIMKVLNKNDVLLEEGGTLPFEQTFCKLSVDHGSKTLMIPDITLSDLTRDMVVTKNLGGGSFIGIPIYYEDGENYGTLCGLDNRPHNFREDVIELFETMGSLLTYVLELDDAYQQIRSLSVPLIPITKGVAALTIIGNVNEQRADTIISLALEKSQDLALDYLIIDLSGIEKINEVVSYSLLKIVNLLQLIGVTPILTGITPDVAIKAIGIGFETDDILIQSNLEQALKKIGFTLHKNDVRG
ncbi:STAS domain-containing protein [Sutcliffiella horikoshii]|uniref:STAS domain-containing protein n=1 Tax=Sutcliffiella horikoshii TaxID=79883 RepID=UPI0020408A61|nr:STAS domain-containing protein [Sutcliffiella horikoshii]MCM3620309.1 STAS domain-containing protein [Sutcliffiella horikoshii]